MGKRNNHRYTEEFRMEVMSYLYSHNGDRVKTRAKFGLNESSLRNWIRKYSGEEKCVSLQSEIEKNEPMEQQAAGMTVLQVNQLWVVDITYVWIEGDVLYLHLVTDAYSHAVIGWCLSDTLEADNTVKALQMAIRATSGGNLCGTMHHSDKGVQYACYKYADTLVQHHIRINMTERYNPTDNAVAERMNGILKTEWIYNQEQFRDRELA